MRRLLLLPLALLPALLLPAADPPLPDGTEAAKKQMAAFAVPKGMKVELWAAEPQLQSPVAISVDDKGRVFVAEVHRLNRGVVENRDNPSTAYSFFLDDDLQSKTTADRLKVYEKFKDKVSGGMDFYTKHADKVRRLEDTKGAGKADKSTVFADGFNGPLDGIMAGVMAYNGDVYVTEIPSLWKLRGADNDTALGRQELLTGFGPNIAFFGHDLHGLTVGPDGRFYFSVGDRGFNVKSMEGKEFVGPRTGGVFRCDPDGRNFEVVHRGLRNPQELAFDEHGNLFADDNNCDKGDHGRLVYVCDGGDSGWNMAYQTVPDPYLTGPWHAERLWHLPHAGQPAWIVPCVGSIGTGPSGFLFTSGTTLPDRYKNSFLMCNYTGNGGLEAWKLKPQGAGFEIVDYHDFLKPIKATDAEFGPDGKLYVSDYVDLKWDGASAGGRIYTVFDPAKIDTAEAKEAKKLFAEGFSQRKTEDLVKLLDHADLKVRQRAQFALAEKREVEALTKVTKDGKGLARLHGIWGLWQISRKDLKALAPVADLLADDDAEVKAQAAKVLGDRRYEAAADKLTGLLTHPSARVQFFAAQAVGQLKHKPAADKLFEVLKSNADADPFVRHAASTALARIADGDALAAKAKDASAGVRLGAVLALRKLSDKRVSAFLADADLNVKTEAARAVHDVPLEGEYPALAKLLADAATGKSDPLARRAIHAAYRLGGADHAKAVFKVVTDAAYSAPVRAEALACLKAWADPTPRDRVTGFWRPLAKRDGKDAVAVVEAGLNDLLSKTSGKLQTEAVGVVAALGVKADEKQFETWAGDAKADANLRAAALRFLAVRKAKGFDAAYTAAVSDASPALRATGRDLFADVDPDKAVDPLIKVLNDDKAALVERQRAVATLGRLKGEAIRELDGWGEKLAAGKVPAELVVDVWDVLKASQFEKWKQTRQKFEATLPADPVGRFASSRTGGDAERGRDIFFNHTAAQCVRCHKAGESGGIAGPELNGVVKRHPDKTRDYLLESLVKPNAQIAPGFASITLSLLDGQQIAGTLMKEEKGDYEVKLADGKIVKVKAADIDTKTQPVSAMPAVDKALTPREMRDLIEYLMTLK